MLATGVPCLVERLFSPFIFDIAGRGDPDQKGHTRFTAEDRAACLKHLAPR